MLEFFVPIKRLFQEESVCIENVVFRFHCRISVFLFLLCAALVTAKQYIGEPITCIADRSIDRSPLNAYCWIYSTFTVSRHLKGVRGVAVASPGVGQAHKDDELLYHSYYQWVCFILGLQASLFYAPRAIWGLWERGTIAFLASDLNSPFVREAWTEERKRQLVGYFVKTNLWSHNFYALRYFLCEILNFLNAVGQIYLLDLFLEGQFGRYGAAVVAFATGKKPVQMVDPMDRLFPKVTKCTMHTIGVSGSTQIHDALCILPLNVMNEKVFVFIWFWLLFLAALSTCALFYRIIVFSQPWARTYLLQGVTRVINRTKARNIVRMLTFGDWFLLYQLEQNVNPLVYRELVNELAASFSSKHFHEVV